MPNDSEIGISTKGNKLTIGVLISLGALAFGAGKCIVSVMAAYSELKVNDTRQMQILVDGKSARLAHEEATDKRLDIQTEKLDHLSMIAVRNAAKLDENSKQLDSILQLLGHKPPVATKGKE